ncbi:hypothetical protein F941_02179 [Acinetobacter bouvetii DSM 14964 = CIP 107468]|uniref:DUF11 domain-containing protein n=1 Tax=Acinetobacter bouvetii DSM 14964 = CIP 107468 TaxID=1120925 RepID=N9DIB6_9GAMM|nr:hypothetical protein [Acinetobacter bouvetii]ENV82379.1 hypothetical protein F941_02179 [Acinetobacter bouvetii DSM 14964 = CIP 107468]BCU64220.1 hypothetical protein ACBO_10110 [Acinetobacter bouvetii]
MFSSSKSILLFLSSLSIMGAAHAAAANTQPLVAEMKVFEVDAKQKGQKELKATDQVKPNSVLEYRVDYSNVSSNSLKNLKLNLPLPEYVTYTGQSAPKDTYASLDGKSFAKAPLTRVENGKKVNVPLREYRALQWNISELKPKQKVTVSAQVRVNASK